jgi:uncharacterized membrane protein
MKDGVIELQQPVGGEHSPVEGDELRTGSTAQDARDMERLGRAQQLKACSAQTTDRFGLKLTNIAQRTFHPLATLGLTTIIMGTYLGMIASSTFSLINGGRAGIIYTFIITWIFQVPVIGSMAEMARYASSALRDWRDIQLTCTRLAWHHLVLASTVRNIVPTVTRNHP